MGQLVLVLAIAGLLGRGIPHRAAWTALIVLGMALALGRHDPLYAKLLVRLPPWSLLRYPEKFLLLATTGLTFAGALGWEQVLARRDLGDRRAASRPLVVAVGVLILSMGLFGLPFVRPDLARALVIATRRRLHADLERYRLGFLGLEALVTCAFALGSLAILLLHRVRRAREWWLAAGVLLLVAADLYRTGHRFVVTARAADLLPPPPVLATLPDPSARLLDRSPLLSRSRRPSASSSRPCASIPVSFIPDRDELLPYWANLWGIPYALNEDFDLMLTTPARHALDVFRTRTKLGEQGLNDQAMAYLGAWNACNVARRRAPETLAEEYRRTGIPPQRLRIVGNPFCLDRFRFRAGGGGVLGPELGSRGRARARIRRLEPRVPGRRDGRRRRRRATRAGGRLSSVDENGADVDLDYTGSGPSLLVAAMTYDRKWKAAVDGNWTTVVADRDGPDGDRSPVRDASRDAALSRSLGGGRRDDEPRRHRRRSRHRETQSSR